MQKTYQQPTVLIILTVLVLMILRLVSPADARQEKVFGIHRNDTGETRVIVGFRNGQSAKTVTSFGGKVIRRLRLANAVAARLPADRVFALAEREHIAFIEADQVVHALADDVPWGVDRIDAEKVHPQHTGIGAKVAIVDTGIDYTHPDLNANYMGGYDFVNDDSDPWDDHGHGTHCAGIVAAEADGEGVVGVGPEAGLYALKVLAANGSGWTSDIIAAIEWAVENGVDVVSMSLGGPAYSRAFDSACANAYDAGILLVAATGNDYGAPISYPAAYDSVVAVTATDSADRLAGFSNTGPEAELAAPGVQILSTVPNAGYESWSGTSMATPHVSGVAALIISADPTLSNQAIRTRLQDTAEDLGESGKDDRFGYGLIDAEAAVAGRLGGRLFVSVVLQGRTNHSNAMVFVDGRQQLTSADGYAVFDLVQGSYTAEVMMDGYLYATKTFEMPGKSDVTLPSVTLLGGDVNNDGVINVLDLSAVGSAYGSQPPSDPAADINDDNRVDVFDLTLVGSNYGREAPGPW